MAKQLRVHTLAKELSVSSKDIIEKCRAEGIELPNHMAAISIGLAESIREWFSVGADVTSVEAAAPVDLKKVRKPRARPKLAAEPLSEGPTVVAEPPASETAAPAPAPPLPAIETPAPPPAQPAVVESEPSVAPVEPVLPAAAEPEPTQRAEPVRPAAARPAPAPPRTSPEPAREPVRPAGPQLVPRPAELQGPRVVRIEAPEPVRLPRPRPAPMAPMMPAAGPSPESRVRGKRKAEEDREAAKTRARSPRRQGTNVDVVERMVEWRDQDVIERKERLASATGHGLRDRRAAERRRLQTPQPATAPGRREEVEITTPITLQEFCAVVGVRFPVVLARLMEHTGKMYTINQAIGTEEAELVALDLGITLKIRRSKSALEKLEEEYAQRERRNLKPRPPIVAMLGHVDHGKTSLLDAIRSTKVAAGEAGGITQRIGAYRIQRGNWDVTFIDTPGHEAFTAMRARGAHLTDVVVLVVAADDGIMPQTVEAINHARAAGVQIVVALNKIDLPGVDVNRVYGQLAEHELTPTEWGGNTDVIKTSATTGKGIDELIAHLSTLSDLLDLKADPDVPAQATVIEAMMLGGLGSVAQVLVREGTLRQGQFIVCGAGAGRVRSLINDQGRRLKEAGPGSPVLVGGLDELPLAGDRLYVVDDLSTAKEIAAEVARRRREESLLELRKPQTLEDLLQAGQKNEVPELNLIVRADGQAAVESLRAKLQEFPSDKARLRILHAGVGAISEADVMLAHTSRAVIVGYTVVADDRARQLADQLGVQIRQYRIIYEIVDDVQKALEGLLAPEQKIELRGKAEVRQVFNVSKIGTIAGCYVVDGTIHRGHSVRLVRDGRLVVERAAIGSLKRFKDDAREVRAGLECGIKIAGFDDVKPGDVIESLEVVQIAQRL